LFDYTNPSHHRTSMEYPRWETKAIKPVPFYPPEIPHQGNQHPTT